MSSSAIKWSVESRIGKPVTVSLSLYWICCDMQGVCRNSKSVNITIVRTCPKVKHTSNHMQTHAALKFGHPPSSQ
jgi:hypothetical protein